MAITRPVTVTIPHQLGREEARARLQRGMGQVRGTLQGISATLDDRWTGDRLDFRVAALSQVISGTLDVREDAVDLRIELPWMLAMLAEKIRGKVQQQGTLLLGKPDGTKKTG
ncbi:MAG TPA: polyhydroxyalkanoic acid system family protein [Azospirillaceae bacterium]|nr:polyhydroxyalkanoic acid system family protein [Azospirillaceae bacterium]